MQNEVTEEDVELWIGLACDEVRGEAPERQEPAVAACGTRREGADAVRCQRLQDGIGDGNQLVRAAGEVAHKDIAKAIMVSRRQGPIRGIEGNESSAGIEGWTDSPQRRTGPDTGGVFVGQDRGGGFAGRARRGDSHSSKALVTNPRLLLRKATYRPVRSMAGALASENSGTVLAKYSLATVVVPCAASQTRMQVPWPKLSPALPMKATWLPSGVMSRPPAAMVALAALVWTEECQPSCSIISQQDRSGTGIWRSLVIDDLPVVAHHMVRTRKMREPHSLRAKLPVNPRFA